MFNSWILGKMDYRKEDKIVGRTQIKEIAIIDTAKVPDCIWKYETAVSHKDFNEKKWIIVEGYMTKKEAEEGHKKWIEKITNNDYDELYCIFSSVTYKRSESI